MAVELAAQFYKALPQKVSARQAAGQHEARWPVTLLVAASLHPFMLPLLNVAYILLVVILTSCSHSSAHSGHD